MIKNIIFPERYGDYYLFSQTRLGFDINKTKVRATEVLAKGKKRIIKKFLEEPISQDASIEFDERVGAAIKNILSKVKRYDAIFTTIASSKVVFKELTLPFSDYDKLNAIIRFEVEQYLPFSAHDAFIDFLITKKTEQETSVLVAAVKHEYIAEHLKFFELAEVEPQKISIDLFEVYGLFKRIPSYAHKENDVCLVDLGLYTTRLGYIVDGKLTNIRMLNKGITTYLPSSEGLEHLYRFGIEESEELPDAFKNMLRDIQFTISSFKANSKSTAPTELLLFGDGASIRGIKELICHDTPYQCNLFDTKLIAQDPNISFSTQNNISLGMVTSLATALSGPETENFNVMPRGISEEKLLNKQLIATGVLLGLLFLGVATHAFFQLRKLRSEYNASEKQAINQLKMTLGISGKTLSNVVEDAKVEVEKEENIWFSLSPQNRTSFLKYLEELSTVIDREGVGLNLKKLSLKRDEIVLEGSLRERDYKALDAFQSELRRSNLFSLETPLQSTNFKALRLIISRNGEEY